MRLSRRILFVQAVLTLVVVCATQLLAQQPQHFPPNTGIYKDSTAPLSPMTRFWASDAGKNLLLHSPSPMAPALLKWFHPDIADRYPQEPLRKLEPSATPSLRPPVTVTGCGTTTGTVMNLEPAVNAVTQSGPMIDFMLSELGSGKDLVAEYGYDERGTLGMFDSTSVMYVHRDPTQDCYGGTDLEMGNPPIPDPFNTTMPMYGGGGGRIIADTNPAHKQFILADVRFDEVTSGIGLRRVPASNLESTSTCPAGTLTSSQEATCAGSTGIIVYPSEDNLADSVAIAQDPRTSGTGAGDIYVVSPSERELRTLILISACKATFASASDCSGSVALSGATNGGLPSVAVLGGGPNAGTITISYVADDGSFRFVACTPAGAPNPPNCASSHLIYADGSLYSELTDNSIELTPWPQIAARTDSGGQTIFVVWSDCAVPLYSTVLFGCPQAQVVMATNTSISSPSFGFHHVTGSAGHHFLPSVAYDSGQNITTLSYYHTVSDIYKNTVRMSINQIASGSTSPEGTVVLNTTYDSVEGNGLEFFGYQIGDYVGIAAHGGSASGSSRVYVGFTSNARQGTYSGISNTQADNAVLRATY